MQQINPFLEQEQELLVCVNFFCASPFISCGSVGIVRCYGRSVVLLDEFCSDRSVISCSVGGRRQQWWLACPSRNATTDV